MDTTQPNSDRRMPTSAPRPTRHDSHATFAMTVHAWLRIEGVPDLVTDSEAHRLAARFGLDIYDPADHSTPVPRASLARAIARRVNYR